MHKGNTGFKSPVDTRITDLFKKAKELQAEKETAKSQEVSVVIESEKKISVTQIEPEIKLPVGYIGLTGISIKDDGVITKDQHMAKLSIDAEKYGNIVLTQEEATQVMKQMKRMTSGVNSVVALRCTGDMCAFKNSCQPEGTLVLTSNHGYIPIQDLNPSIHKLASYNRERNRVFNKQGFDFTMASRSYNGNIIKIAANNNSHYCTPDHISIAVWNEKALNKFCVYIMKRGNFWRIGKTFLLKEDLGNHKCGFYRFGIRERLMTEKADSAWLLGVYDTNTEALLAEEYYSCTLGVSKACFLVANHSEDSKYDGLYRWITQDQLDAHHQRLAPTLEFITNKLNEFGLDINCPIYSSFASRDPDISYRLATLQTMKIRSCNLVSKYMNVIIYENGEMKRFEMTKSVEDYNGTVYSLDVNVTHTYIANGIITHNCVYYEIGKPPLGKSCLVEAQLIEYWTAQYFEEFNVDPSRVTEVHLISELAELDIYEMRVTKYLAENHPTLLQEMMTGVDAAGNVISNLDISRAFDLKERLKKQRMKVLEALMATRKEKIKAVSVVSGSTDTATKIAELKDKLDRLHRDVSNVEIIEGESVRLN